jgi:dolichol-phosphate mannosyltransferase
MQRVRGSRKSFLFKRFGIRSTFRAENPATGSGTDPPGPVRPAHQAHLVVVGWGARCELPDVSVVLPTFNERDAFQLLHRRIESALAGFTAEVIVVDDDSPDGTARAVDEIGRPDLYRILRRPGRLGLASAVLEGVADSTGRAVVVMDADGSHPPELIPQLVHPVLARRSEFVLASRKVPGGSAPGLVGVRRAISWAATMLTWPLSPVLDPMSGYFAFDRSILRRATLRPIGYKIGLEILVRCRPQGVLELPFAFQPRLAGESKLNGTEVRGYLRHLMRLYGWRLSGFGRASRTR